MAAVSNGNVHALEDQNGTEREAAKRRSGGRDNRCADKRDIAKLGGAVTSTNDTVSWPTPTHPPPTALSSVRYRPTRSSRLRRSTAPAC